MTAPTLVGSGMSSTTSNDPIAVSVQAGDVVFFGYFSDNDTALTAKLKNSAGSSSIVTEDETIGSAVTGTKVYDDGTSGVPFYASSTQTGSRFRLWRTKISSVTGSPTVSCVADTTVSRRGFVFVVRPVSGDVAPARGASQIGAIGTDYGWAGGAGAQTVSGLTQAPVRAVVISLLNITSTTPTVTTSDSATDLTYPTPGASGYHLLIQEYDANASPTSVAYTASAVWGNTNNALNVIVDAMAAAPITRTPTDPLGLTDNVAVTKTINRTINDALGLADNHTAGSGTAINRTINDPLGLADSVPRQLAVTINDHLGLADNGTTAVGTNDTVFLTDTIEADFGWGRVVNDPVGLTDNVGITKTINRTINDALGLADTVSYAIPGRIGLSEHLGLTDNINTALASNHVLTDGVGLTDTVTVLLTHAPTPEFAFGAAEFAASFGRAEFAASFGRAE